MAPRKIMVGIALASLLVLLSIAPSVVFAGNDHGEQWIPGHNGSVTGDPNGGGGGDGTGDPDEVAVLVVPPEQIEFTTFASPEDRDNASVRIAHRIDMRFLLMYLISLR